MKTTAILALSSLIALPAFGANLSSLAGEYSLKANENVQCPKEARIAIKKNLVEVYGSVYENGERYARVYENVNGGKNNYPDDFGTSTQSISAFKNNVLTSYGRSCSGLIIKSCGDWIQNHYVDILNEKTSEIRVYSNSAPFSYDYSGFPTGIYCNYTRN